MVFGGHYFFCVHNRIVEYRVNISSRMKPLGQTKSTLKDLYNFQTMLAYFGLRRSIITQDIWSKVICSSKIK